MPVALQGSEKLCGLIAGTPKCQSPCRCTFLVAAFFTRSFGTGCVAGSVPPAIPLTRLHNVVLAREEDPGASTCVHVVRVSAYLRGDFGVTRGSRRDEGRDMRWECNGIRTRTQRNVVQREHKIIEILVIAFQIVDTEFSTSNHINCCRLDEEHENLPFHI